jgi:hypothetical protein
MNNKEENILNNTLNKIEFFTKLLGNRNTYEKEEQCARIVKDLSEAYLNIMNASEGADMKDGKE